MIQSLEVSNFKSLGPNTLIDLGKLIVFVGQNAAGKSSILDVFRFISDSMKIGLEGAITKRHGIKAIRRWSNGRPFAVSIKVKISEPGGYNATYFFSIGGDSKEDFIVTHEKADIIDPELGTYGYEVQKGRWMHGPEGITPSLAPMSLALPLISGDARFSRLENALKSFSIYNIFPDTLRTPQIYDPQKPMAEHGSNWTSILKDQAKATWEDELIIALRKLTGEIDGIEIKPIASYLIAKFKHGKGGNSQKAKWFDATQESDGTLRMAGIITALLQQPHLPLIGIEEPELTIHPGAIPVIYDYLIQAQNRSQILVTTHSPELLDSIKDPTQIRVVSKRDDYTIVESITDDQIAMVKNGLMSLGEIHRTEGLKGVYQGKLNFEDV